MKFKGFSTTVAVLFLGLSFAGCQSANSALRQKAEQGDAEAQYNLGLAYAGGKEVPRDYKQAVKWVRLAAEQGHAKAQYGLGNAYYKGQTVPQDYKEAVKWFRLAAEQGDATAQYNMGFCYANGTGVPQDNVQAYVWYNVAATQGNKDAAANRAKIMEKATPTQIEEGQRLSREYAEKFIKK
jgi:TPR repeat protein